MKKFALLLLTGWCGVLAAQTNAPAPVPADKPVKTSTSTDTNAPMQITSDSAEVDMVKRQAEYRGNVRVDRQDMKLTCGWMLVTLPEAGGRLDRVTAETNVVIDFTDEKGQTYHVTSAKAVYDFKVENSVTNETVTFTGSPRVETSQSIIESEPMVWDRVKNKFFFSGPKMISKGTPGSETNGAPPKLF